MVIGRGRKTEEGAHWSRGDGSRGSCRRTESLIRSRRKGSGRGDGRCGRRSFGGEGGSGGSRGGDGSNDRGVGSSGSEGSGGGVGSDGRW